MHARTQMNVLPTVVLEAQSSPELVDLITNKCVPCGKTARMAVTYRKQKQPNFLHLSRAFCEETINGALINKRTGSSMLPILIKLLSVGSQQEPEEIVHFQECFILHTIYGR